MKRYGWSFIQGSFLLGRTSAGNHVRTYRRLHRDARLRLTRRQPVYGKTGAGFLIKAKRRVINRMEEIERMLGNGKITGEKAAERLCGNQYRPDKAVKRITGE